MRRAAVIESTHPTAFAFAAGHVVSRAVAFRLRHQGEAARMLALLVLSGWSIGINVRALLVVPVVGMVESVVVGFLGRPWPRVAIVLLIAIAMLMAPVVGSHFNRIRQALGQRVRTMSATDPDPVALRIEDVIAITRERSLERAPVGGGGSSCCSGSW